MDIGLILIIALIIVFYLRLYMIRGKKKRLEREALLEQMKQGKKGRGAPVQNANTPTFNVRSWWILVPGMILMLVGLGIYTQAFLLEFKIYWWIPVVLGEVLFIFSFK